MVREAELEQTGAGLVPVSDGWFVMSARDARWIDRPGRGRNLPFTGWTENEAETFFQQLGVSLVVLGPGEPIGMYHWEADQEDFLVLSGEALLIVEGQERPLRQAALTPSCSATSAEVRPCDARVRIPSLLTQEHDRAAFSRALAPLGD